MATKPVKIELDLKDRDAKRKLKNLAKETGEVEEGFEEAESAGKTMARAIERSADDMITEIDATKRAVDAMERSLGDVDADPREVVADLKRIGLTAEDIEQDADDLARALQRSGDVRVHAADQGFDDLDQALGTTTDNSRLASTAVGGIGNSISELPGVGSLGPVAESMGMLAENALEGEGNLKGLVAAGAGLAALGFTVQQIQGHFANIAETEAWKEEQVESYTEALSEAETAVEGIADKLSEVDNRAMNFGGGIEISGEDMTRVLTAVGLSLEDVSTLLDGGIEDIDAWRDHMLDSGADSQQVALTYEFLTSELGFVEEASENAAAAQEFLGDAHEDGADAARTAEEATDDYVSALEDEADALRESAAAAEEQIESQMAMIDAEYALQEAIEDVADARENYTETVAEFGEGSEEAAEALDDLFEAELDAADGAARLAEASGGDAVTSLDAMTDSLLDGAAAANGPARRAVLGHIQRLHDIPDDVMTEIEAAIDRGDLATAEQLINDVSRTRESAIHARVNDLAAFYAEVRLNNIARQRDVVLKARTVGGFNPRVSGPGGTSLSIRGATGGIVNRPTEALIGEAGPEAVIPLEKSPGNGPLPNGGLGGDTYNITNNYPAGTRPADVRQSERRYRRIQGPV